MHRAVAHVCHSSPVGPNAATFVWNECICCKMANSEREIVPAEIVEAANAATLNLLPKKSSDKYKSTYTKFLEWKKSKNIGSSFDESVLLVYFDTLSTTMKPSSLWSIYSMLKSTINLNDGINISHYAKLQTFLKRQSTGFMSKKSQVLTAEDTEKFIREAPDDRYLATKVSIKKSIISFYKNLNHFLNYSGGFGSGYRRCMQKGGAVQFDC